jgi:bis(5'-nucleosyl)-tetraphosphatase (symmetrical)
VATYAIGDVQGCFDELSALLRRLEFDAERDRLWFAGDLVNRGPKSLETLRFVRDLGDRAITVLGNHDLHLLAAAFDVRLAAPKDTFEAVLAAPDRDELLDWLRHRPLLHHEDSLGFTLIHAGLPPQWDLRQALSCAAEVEAVLRGDGYGEFFQEMYGNRPNRWSDGLAGWDRLRFIVNCFTRLRYCMPDGRLMLKEKGQPGTQRSGALPWFSIPGRASRDLRILFGHWSTLGPRPEPGIFPLDTGCLWGGELTALRLEDRQRFRWDCPGWFSPGTD